MYAFQLGDTYRSSELAASFLSVTVDELNSGSLIVVFTAKFRTNELEE